ncbi:hypothetical protein B4N84_12870 [Flavobacterium sp. IR1]|nr:hypothetical protein B4N84_12870 [Flavobacterium sp. IR1]
MTKFFQYLKSKSFLRYLIVFLCFLLTGCFILLYSYFNVNTIKLKKINNSQEIKRLSDSADIYMDSNRKDSAIYFFNKAKKLCDPKVNTIDYVYILSCIAEIQMNHGNFIDSEDHANQAIPYLKYIKNPRYTWIVYNIMAINHANNYDDNTAIIYFKKCLALNSSAWRRYLATNNLAASYMNQGKFEEAIQLFLPLLKQKHISQYEDLNTINYAFVIDNLGFCYYKQKKYKLALQYMNEALKIRLNEPTQDGLVINYIHLIKYHEKNNPKLAAQYAKSAYAHTLKTKNAKDEIRALSMLIKYTDDKNLKTYSKNYIRLIDSSIATQQKIKDQSINIKYDSKTDKDENLQLKADKAEDELELERQKKRNIILYVIIGFILNVLLILILKLTSIGRKNKNEAIFTSESRISKKLHDELANEVHDTILFAEDNDLENEANKEQFLNSLETIYSHTRRISKENSIITTDGNYEMTLKEMISEFKTEDQNILIHGFDGILWSKLEKNKKIVLYRVLQEFFVNIKKYSNPTLISLTFKIVDKYVIINYIDNDVESGNENLFLKNELQNVESRIKTINGTIIFGTNSRSGLKVSFSFPL